MKKSFLTLIVLLGLAIPLACSNNNNPTSPAATATPVPTATNWAGYTNTFTPTSTPSATPTATNANGYTSTFTPTPTITATFTITPTFTITSTFTNTATTTPTSTPFTLTPPPYKNSGPSPIRYPNGVAIGNGNLYVAEGDGASVSVVQVFNATSLAPVTTISGYGATLFGNPGGVAVNASTGNIYVVDTTRSAVYEFSSGGATVTSWSSWSGGSVTSFLNPEGIAVDGAGDIFVADTRHNAVEEFTTTGSTVNYKNQWNTGTTAFSSPSAVAAVTSTGPVTTLYVADAGNRLVQKFNGSTWTSWSTPANSDVFGIALDANGYVYTADLGNGLVEEYNGSGSLLTQWNGSSGPAPFVGPDGVVFLDSTHLFVSDYNNGSSHTGSVEEFGP